jgi:AGZA family xanthine/uracil permease-like MFS transporter
VARIAWSDYTESVPAFLTMLGIPLSYSIADGLALGLISYPVIKLLTGRGREVSWLMYVLAAVLAVYFVAVRSTVSPPAG